MQKIKSSLIPAFLMSTLLGACHKEKVPDNASTPVIESVTIGNQVWMKKNLNIDRYKNGEAIPEVKDFNVWQNLTTGAWHYYNNDTANGRVYGKLYNWYAVNDSRGLAPAGWHIPTDAEWTTLTDYLGGTAVAGGKMKEAGTAHWVSPNTGADNASGFTALGAGTSTSLIFWQFGYNTYWWSSTSFNGGTYALFRAVYNDGAGVNRSGTDLYHGFSVRCVRD